MKNNFICILGIDGSGKSTLAENIILQFQKKGDTYRYIWGGCRHYLSYPLIFVGKRLLLRKSDQQMNYQEYRSQVQKRSKNPLISSIYFTTVLIDYYLQLFFRIWLQLFTGNKIITDRYVYGTLVDMAVNLDFDENLMIRYIRQFLSFCLKPDVILLIDIPEHLAFERKSDTPSIDYLRVRRTRYLRIAKEFDIPILDGRKKQDELLVDAYQVLKNS